MVEPRKLTLPLAKDEAASLRAGDALLLSGPVFTSRDAGHVRLLAALEEEGRLPFDLEGQTLFYAGPTPASAGRPLGAVGPTTSGRMDFAAPALYRAGIVATIGKGSRDPEVAQACMETGSVYLCAVGGSAALLAKCVVSAETIAYDDLGTEALRRLELRDFPCFVALDVLGNDVYAQAKEAGAAQQ